jgi:chemotaxis protein MotB
MGAKKLEAAVLDKNLQKEIKVVVTEQWAKIDMQDTGLFDPGSAELKPDCFPILETIAKTMISKNNMVQVEGHTDNRPILRGCRYSSNWELSMARAYSVIRKLEESGIESKQLSGSGYGEHRPAADNSTPEGRAKNRRIEIKVLRASE